MMVLYSPDWTNTGFSFILLTVNLFRHSTLTEQGLYHKYSDTLNTFNMLCPLNKAKVIFKGSSKNQFYFSMLHGTLSFLQKYLFLLLSFQFYIIYGTCSQNV